jgi:hypothetical protein
LTGQLLHKKGTRIMTGAFVGFTGITEPNNELDSQQEIDSLFRCGLLALSFASVFIILGFAASGCDNRRNSEVVIVAQSKCSRLYTCWQGDVGQVDNLTQLDS